MSIETRKNLDAARDRMNAAQLELHRAKEALAEAGEADRISQHNTRVRVGVFNIVMDHLAIAKRRGADIRISIAEVRSLLIEHYEVCPQYSLVANTADGFGWKVHPDFEGNGGYIVCAQAD